MARKYLALGLIVCFLGGCLAFQVRPPTDRVDAIQRIVVVPVESPPLLGGPESSPHASGSESGLLILLAPIWILYGLVSWMLPASAPGTLQDLPSGDPLRLPAVILAAEVAREIDATDSRQATVSQKYYKFAELGESLDAWDSTLRSWFNQNTSPVLYEELQYEEFVTQDIDGVVEVGVSVTMIRGGDFYGQVLLKLVDPVSGRVLGRARSHNVPYSFTWPEAKRDEFSREYFAETARELVIENLKYLGFLPV